jgi:5-oxoprolinase (ATP-hydrolysing) subunit A
MDRTAATFEFRGVSLRMKRVDLNCDMGEVAEAVTGGAQEELLRCVTSANVACGGHASDAAMMQATIEQCLRHGVAIGAHPGYEDRANFGRIEVKLSGEEVAASVHRQVLALAEIAACCGARITHVKPHGALYNHAARERELARAIAEGVARWTKDVVLVGLAGSAMLEEFRAAGFRVAAEAFADRRYDPDRSLRSRKFQDALLRNPEEAAAQAVQIVEQGSVIAADGSAVPLHAQTICIHGDTPGSTQIAAAVNRALRAAGIELKAISAT